MKHETRLLNLEIKSKNSPILFASSYTEIWRQTLFCKQVTCFQGLPGSDKSKTTSHLPSKHHTNESKWPKLMCTHTKKLVIGGKKGYKR